MKKYKEKFVKQIKKVKMALGSLGVLMSTWWLLGMQVYADTTTTTKTPPKIVTGTYNLIQDATKWLAIIIVALTALMAAYKAAQWQAAMDEEKSKAAKALRNTIIIGVIAASISGIISFVLSYYQ